MDQEGVQQTKPAKSQTSGQAIMEYVLLLSMVLGVVTYTLRLLYGGMDKSTAKYGGIVEKQLRTGSAPASIWTK